jgi:predicted lipoprotein with Yx(FWY)xxD motif
VVAKQQEVVTVKQFLILGATLAASLALAACGGGDGSSSESPASSGSAAAGGSDTVAVKSIDGVGNVLVDPSGKALYASDVEADGKVQCTDACESFWKPLTVDSGKPTAASSDVGKLGVVKRPDGGRQVTVDGKLLYTFTEDSAGEAKGNGFADDFAGQHFTWNAVLEGGKLASNSGGDSSDDDSSGGGYGY